MDGVHSQSRELLRKEIMTAYEDILIESPAEGVRRIVLNKPDKRNAISTPMRTEILEALQKHDRNDDVRVTIICGAGKCFSSGYDLSLIHI